MKTLIIIMSALLFSGCYMSEEEMQKKVQECNSKGEFGVLIRIFNIPSNVTCVVLPKPAPQPEVKTPVQEVKPASVIDITGNWRNYEDTVVWQFDKEGWLTGSVTKGKKVREFKNRYFKVESWKGYHIAGTTDANKVVPVTEDILEVTPGKEGRVTYLYRGKVLNTLTEGQVLSDLVKLIHEDELWELDQLAKGHK